ncbi:MAG: choice-of-anchor I family protein, partial [Flavobacteriales bacterium]
MNRFLLGIFALFGTLSGIAQNQPISLQHLSTTHLAGGFASGAAEISSFNPGAKRLYVVNGSTDEIDVLDVANPLAPEYLFSIDISSYGAGANSVVTFDNYVAIAVEAFVQQDAGTILITDIDGTIIASLEAGALPDMIGISPDHTKLYTANEGQPSDDYSFDPEGSITIVDLTGGVETVTQAQVHQLYFDQFEFIRNSFEMQYFDNWMFTANPTPYALGGAYSWGEVTSLGGHTALHSDTFWGVQGLNNAEHSGWHSLEFETTSIAGRPRASVSIRYFYENFESTDSIGFTIVNGTEGAHDLENFVALPPVTQGWGEYVFELDPTLLDVSVKLWVKCDEANDLAGFDDVKISFVDPSVRVTGQFGLSTLTQDMEPEYISSSADGSFAQVSLQENNAMAIIDLETLVITDVVGLGFKDYSLPGNGIDASNQDGGINIQNWPVKGMYMPDAVASFSVNGETYFVSANEGDARAYGGFNEEARVSTLTLDPTAYPNGTTLKQNANLGRLMSTRATGDSDGDGDVDQIYSYGARSFSIWNENAELVYDSGDQFEQITAQLDPTHFNSNNDDNTSFDSRSDDKGPEPEGVATGVIAGRNYAFVCLERIGGIMVYDVTNPQAPEFIEYFNNRNWTASDSDPASLDQGPEGLTFISKENSPNERDLLVLSNEISGTVSIF